ncbi:hypothetical protein [Kitasatospora sp. NBC_00315]|uniref:hypothetical protein n=1 Tax=Kitasatospora sp. NBC_00315 TaxID=2975963 RepID=UPI00324E5329
MATARRGLGHSDILKDRLQERGPLDGEQPGLPVALDRGISGGFGERAVQQATVFG